MDLRRTLLLLVLLVASLGRTAHAILTIEITGGTEGATPIAVVPFGWQGPAASAPEDIATIIANDLRRSGRFAPLPEQDFLSRPTDAAQINYTDWRVLGADSLVIGRVEALGGDRYVVQFQLFDVFQAKQLTGYSIPTSGAELRRSAHYIADLIYEQLTGEPGAFDTRIAYITASRGANKRYSLQVADSDGYNPKTIVNSIHPLMSPAWAPDGRRLSYVSFEAKRASLYVQDVYTGSRQRVAAYPGINGAPAWSPDGNRLALTLSRDGNPEIYILDLRSNDLRRVTVNSAIDTEPVWSPDGYSLYFTSDRGGGPQIYRVPASGGGAERVTFEGPYNAGADITPDGKYLALVNGAGGGYRIAVMEIQSGNLSVVTNGALDESPSFAPNGSMILYAASEGGRGILAGVSRDGRFRQRLVLQEGDVREPAWSPRLRR